MSALHALAEMWRMWTEPRAYKRQPLCHLEQHLIEASADLEQAARHLGNFDNHPEPK